MRKMYQLGGFVCVCYFMSFLSFCLPRRTLPKPSQMRQAMAKLPDFHSPTSDASPTRAPLVTCSGALNLIGPVRQFVWGPESATHFETIVQQSKAACDTSLALNINNNNHHKHKHNNDNARLTKTKTSKYNYNNNDSNNNDNNNNNTSNNNK